MSIPNISYNPNTNMLVVFASNISNKKSHNEGENEYGVVKRVTLEEIFLSAIFQTLNETEFNSIERTVRNANQRSDA
jgi:hypothetical protein